LGQGRLPDRADGPRSPDQELRAHATC
jgi:hypothetical protein